jgi:hypothetical protein
MKSKNTKSKPASKSKAMPSMSKAQHSKMMGKNEEKGEYGKGKKGRC